MPQCENCESHISEDFRRVFSDDHGNVYACPNCSAQAGIEEESRRRREAVRSQ